MCAACVMILIAWGIPLSMRLTGPRDTITDNLTNLTTGTVGLNSSGARIDGGRRIKV